MRLAMQEQTMGLPTDQVLANILTRSDTPSMRSFVRSVRQGETLGVSIGQILRNLAIEMRKRRRATAEERAQKAPIKILFPLAGLIFPALFVVLLAPAVIKFIESMGNGS
jgi:tight adherence protein C